MRKRTALGDPLTHYWLALFMGKKVGIDLWEARDKGHISDTDFKAVVQRCRGCHWEHDGLCEMWLKDKEDGSIDEAPHRCQNVETFRVLKDHIQETEQMIADEAKS